MHGQVGIGTVGHVSTHNNMVMYNIMVKPNHHGQNMQA